MADINITTEITLNKASFLKDLKALRADINKALAVDGIKVTLDRKAFMKDFKAIAKEVSKGIIVPLIPEDRITPLLNKIRAGAASGVGVGNGATGGGGSAASSAGSRGRGPVYGPVDERTTSDFMTGGRVPVNASDVVMGNAARKRAIGQMGTNARISAAEQARTDRAERNERNDWVKRWRRAEGVMSRQEKEEAQGNAAAARSSASFEGKTKREAAQQLVANAKIRARELSGLDKTRNEAAEAAEAARVQGIRDMGDRARLRAAELGRADASKEAARVQGIKDMGDRARFKAGELARNEKALMQQAGNHYRNRPTPGQGQGSSTPPPNDGLERKFSLAYFGFVAANAVVKAGDYYDYFQQQSAANRLTSTDDQLTNAQSVLEADYSGARGIGQAIRERFGFSFGGVLGAGDMESGASRDDRREVLLNARRSRDAAEFKMQKNAERHNMKIQYGFGNRSMDAARVTEYGTYGSEERSAAADRDQALFDLNNKLGSLPKPMKGEPKFLTDTRNAILGQISAQNNKYSDRVIVAQAQKERSDAGSAYNIAGTDLTRSVTNLNTSQSYFAAQKAQALGDLDNQAELMRQNLRTETNPEVAGRMQKEYDAFTASMPDLKRNIEVESERKVSFAKREIFNQELGYRLSAARSFYDRDLKMFVAGENLKIDQADKALKPGMIKARDAGVAAIMSDMKYNYEAGKVNRLARDYRLYGGNVNATINEANFAYEQRMKGAQILPGDLTNMGALAGKLNEQAEARKERDFSIKEAKVQNARNIRGVLSEAKQIDLNSRGQYRAAEFEGIKGQLDIDESQNADDPAMLAAVRRRGLAQLKQFQLNDARPRSYGSVGEYYNYMAEKITMSATNPNDQAGAEIKRLEDALKGQGPIVANALKEAFKDIQIVGIFNGQ